MAPPLRLAAELLPVLEVRTVVSIRTQGLKSLV